MLVGAGGVVAGVEAGVPTLPAGIEFGHVRRLTLRNMSLEQIDEDFLRRFSHLRELDLRFHAVRSRNRKTLGG